MKYYSIIATRGPLKDLANKGILLRDIVLCAAEGLAESIDSLLLDSGYYNGHYAFAPSEAGNCQDPVLELTRETEELEEELRKGVAEAVGWPAADTIILRVTETSEAPEPASSLYYACGGIS